MREKEELKRGSASVAVARDTLTAEREATEEGLTCVGLLAAAAAAAAAEAEGLMRALSSVEVSGDE